MLITTPASQDQWFKKVRYYSPKTTLHKENIQQIIIYSKTTFNPKSFPFAHMYQISKSAVSLEFSSTSFLHTEVPYYSANTDQ